MATTKLIERKDEIKVTRDNAAVTRQARYERDHEMHEGEFIIHEPNKVAFDFRFKKWKEDDYQQYTLEHRHRYTLPRMVIHHINHGVHNVKYKDLEKMPGITAGNIQSQHYNANNANLGHTVSRENMKVQVKIPRCEFRVTNVDPYDFDLNQPSIYDVSLQR
jgi:hypothetical protein